MATIDAILNDVLAAEGGYVNDPADAGGETNWGITAAVARAHGYMGPMRELTRDRALSIYRTRYVIEPGFDRVLPLSPAVAAELVDTGVNMGQQTAVRMMQRAMNALNRQGKDWPDLAVDGRIGPGTLAALGRLLLLPGRERALLTAMNALQGARYIELAEGRAANETFLTGWLNKRVAA